MTLFSNQLHILYRTSSEFVQILIYNWKETNSMFCVLNGRMWRCWNKKRTWTSWQSSSPMSISMSSTVSSGSWTQTTTSTSTRETWRSTTTKVPHHIFTTALLTIHEADLRCGADARTKHHSSFLDFLGDVFGPCSSLKLCESEREREIWTTTSLILTLSGGCIVEICLPSTW